MFCIGGIAAAEPSSGMQTIMHGLQQSEETTVTRLWETVVHQCKNQQQSSQLDLPHEAFVKSFAGCSRESIKEATTAPFRVRRSGGRPEPQLAPFA